MGSLEEFLEISENPYKHVAEWREERRRKVIGCFPMDIPEEPIHAAGMLPVVIWRGIEPITLGLPYAPTYHCGFVRSFIDDMVKGKLAFMDGMVYRYTCLVARGALYTAGRHNPPTYLRYLPLPLAGSRAARDRGIEVLQDFIASLEEFSGQKISATSLRESIKIYNEHRDLMRKLYEIRRKKPALLKAKEVVATIQASMLMPKEEHNKLLKELIEELETKEPRSDKGVKLVLSGHFCHAPRFDLLDLIEESGGVVVDDDLYVGQRYVAEDAVADKVPVAGLVDLFMKRIPPNPTKVDPKGKWSDWGDFLVETVRRSGAQGVISLMVKFCPPHQEWNPDVRRVLRAAGIPELMIQVEHESVSLAPLKTRVQAFMETLRRR